MTDNARIVREALERCQKLERLAALLGAAWFYGGFKAETANEREQEILMEDLGYVFGSENELIAALTALESALAAARKALGTAWAAMCERRGYADAWEWKYGTTWDEEDAEVSAALNGDSHVPTV